MNPRVVAPATVEPVSLEEAKAQLRVDIADDDDLINRKVRAARLWVEHFTQRTWATTTYELSLDGFCHAIKLPMGPVIEVESVRYDDSNGDEQTVDPTVYRLTRDRFGGDVLALKNGQAWPATNGEMSCIRIRYIAGPEQDGASPPGYVAFPDDVKDGILLLLGDLYENREGQFVGVTSSVNKTLQDLLHFHRVGLGI